MQSFRCEPKGLFISVISPEIVCPLLAAEPTTPITFPGVIAEIVASCISQDLRERQALLEGANEDTAVPVRPGVTISLGPKTSIGNVERIGDNSQLGENVQLANFAKLGSNVEVADGVVIGRGAVIENGVLIGSHSRISEMARLCIGADLGEEVIVGVQAEVGCTTVPTGTVVPDHERYY